MGGLKQVMAKILKMIAQRLGLGLLTLWVVSLIIFLGIELLPGDLAQAILGQAATEETVAAFRRELQLDLPAYERYFNWLAGILQGDMGVSLANKRQISELIGVRFSNTIFLAIVAAVISVPLAVTLGVLAALYRNSLYDRCVNVVTLTSISFPEFFVAYILILFLAVKLQIFPSISNVSPDTDFWDRVYRVALPALTLTLVVIAHMMRMTRAAIINLLASPYIEMANLKGMPRARIIVKHALPNAWAPIINVIVINLAYLIVGVVVVEVVFVYPGLGQLLVDSVSKRDIPVVQAASLIFAATYILLNLTADILSILTNPRLLHPK
jgi:peptide/nickel transport system permease protein